MSHQAPTRTWPWVLATVVVIAVGLGVAIYVRPGPQPSTAAVATSVPTRLPQACLDAMAIGRDLARHAEPLGSAAVDHVVIMERLEHGEITGHEAYELGEGQMQVMESHGAETQIRARRFTKLARRCPLQ